MAPFCSGLSIVFLYFNGGAPNLPRMEGIVGCQKEKGGRTEAQVWEYSVLSRKRGSITEKRGAKREKGCRTNLQCAGRPILWRQKRV